MTAALALLQGPPSVTAAGAGHMLLFDEAARLGAAMAAGGALGLNRSLRGKAAGLRTHALVALGAAVVTAAASHAGDPAGARPVMQGVITGIGFVGAGVILHPANNPLRRNPTAAVGGANGADGGARGGADRRHSERHDVRGLTTAASVWVAAGLGVTAGLGLYSLVLFGALFALAILTGGGGIEDGVRRRLRQRARRRRAARRAVRQVRRAAPLPAPPPRPPPGPRA